MRDFVWLPEIAACAIGLICALAATVRTQGSRRIVAAVGGAFFLTGLGISAGTFLDHFSIMEEGTAVSCGSALGVEEEAAAGYSAPDSAGVKCRVAAADRLSAL